MDGIAPRGVSISFFFLPFFFSQLQQRLALVRAAGFQAQFKIAFKP